MKRSRITRIGSIVGLIVIIGLQLAYLNGGNVPARLDVNGQDVLVSCQDGQESQKISCWQEHIERVVASNGVGDALNIVAYLNEYDITFAEQCHDFMHLVGYRAYRKYASDKTVDVNDKTAYCSFGFYHGFMEVLVGQNNDPAMAREYCVAIGEKLGDTVPDAQYACFHGIGHGWTEVHDTRYWGDQEGISEISLALCADVSDPSDPEQLYRCATGVFDSIALAIYNNNYGMKLDYDDPLWLCRKQTNEVYKRACYSDMMPAIVWMAEYELPKAVAIVEKHAEPQYAAHAMRTVVDDSMRFVIYGGGDAREMIAVCRRRKTDDLVAACIDGVSAGVLQWSPIQTQFDQVLQFCGLDELKDDEQQRCYESVVRYARQVFAENKARQICERIPPSNQKICENLL